MGWGQARELPPEYTEVCRQRDAARQELVDVALERDGLRRSLEAVTRGEPAVTIESHTVRVIQPWRVRMQVIQILLDNPNVDGSTDDLLVSAQKVYDWVKPTEDEEAPGTVDEESADAST